MRSWDRDERSHAAKRCRLPLYPYTLIPLYPYTLIPLYPYTLIPLYPYGWGFPRQSLGRQMERHAKQLWKNARSMRCLELVWVQRLRGCRGDRFLAEICSCGPIPAPAVGFRGAAHRLSKPRGLTETSRMFGRCTIKNGL